MSQPAWAAISPPPFAADHLEVITDELHLHTDRGSTLQQKVNVFFAALCRCHCGAVCDWI